MDNLAIFINMVPRIIVGVLFLVFAVVQYNDPDPWIWVLAYATVGFICFWDIRHTIIKPILIGLILLFTIASAWYIPLIMGWISDGMPSIVGEMKAATPHIEWMREFLGLLLCTSTLIWICKSSFFHDSNKD